MNYELAATAGRFCLNVTSSQELRNYLRQTSRRLSRPETTSASRPALATQNHRDQKGGILKQQNNILGGQPCQRSNPHCLACYHPQIYHAGKFIVPRKHMLAVDQLSHF